MYLTKEISRMRFLTDMLLNNKINKTKHKQQSLFEQCHGCYCMCNFSRYSVDKEGRGTKEGRDKEKERKEMKHF